VRAVLTALILVGFWLLPACGNPLSPPACTVGEAGTDLKVTATGTNAQSFCDGFVKGSSGHGYSTADPDTSGTLMCRYTLGDGTIVTVYDKGLLKLNGNAVCAQLAAQVTPSP
jgi:hypothetical protein